MSRARALLERLRRSPRALAVVAILGVLVVAAVADVPGRLASLAPSDTTATPAPARTTDGGRLTGLVNADNAELDRCEPGADDLARCGRPPALDGTSWLNTPGGRPVDLADLAGSVVLVDFFSISCISCRRDLRYVQEWEDRYQDAGLRIVGVHSPEIDVDRDTDRLGRALDRLFVDFPVMQDEGFAALTDYRTQVLPSRYLVGRDGQVRAIALGEGGYVRIEDQIRDLLAVGGTTLPEPVGRLDDGEETETGTTRQIDLGTTRRAPDQSAAAGSGTEFVLPESQRLGTYSLGGAWTIRPQDAAPGDEAVARVSYRGRTAYQLVSGTGSLVVTTSSGMTRRIRVDGEADLLPVHAAAYGRETLTIRYEGDLRVYAFSFG